MDSGKLRIAWSQFRSWRKGRPFWAGLLTLASGLIVLFPPYASLKFGDMVMSMQTMGGISAMVIGIVMIMLAITLWFQPHMRLMAGIVTLVLAMVALVTANLGSLLMGTLLGIIGSGLAIAWSPTPKAAKNDRRKAKKNPAQHPVAVSETELTQPQQPAAPQQIQRESPLEDFYRGQPAQAGGQA